MKRIKHRDLTHYFLQDHKYLPRAYVASCERFFKRLGSIEPKNRARAPRYNYQASSDKLQAASSKRQVTSHNMNIIK